MKCFFSRVGVNNIVLTTFFNYNFIQSFFKNKIIQNKINSNISMQVSFRISTWEDLFQLVILEILNVDQGVIKTEEKLIMTSRRYHETAFVSNVKANKAVLSIFYLMATLFNSF